MLLKTAKMVLIIFSVFQQFYSWPPLCIYQPFPKQSLVFTCLQYKSFENTMGKEEIAHNEQFLLLSVFSTHLESHFCKICNCRLQTLSVWKSLKFVIWDRVKTWDLGLCCIVLT